MSCSREINDFIAILSTKKTTKIMTQSDKCHALTFLGHAFLIGRYLLKKNIKHVSKLLYV